MFLRTMGMGGGVGPCTSGRTHCTPDSDFKVMQKELHEVHGDFRNTNMLFCLFTFLFKTCMSPCP